MKTTSFGRNWVIPLLGIAVVAGAVIVRANYLRLEQETWSADALQATIDRLYHDQNLSVALKKLHEGDVDGAVKRLDVVLCDDIVRLDSELEDADQHTRTCVGEGLRRIAHVRPVSPQAAQSGTVPGWVDTQTAAQRILSLAVANELRAESKRPGM
jgi:hypothetical protein